MPRPKTSERALLHDLGLLFRDHGFEGASLSRIAAATGLQRASLYHRFPGGKRDMALAVVADIGRRMKDEVLAPLAEDTDLQARLRSVGRNLDAFYEGGARACLTDTLAVGEPDPELQAAVAQALEAMVEAFASAAREAGHTPAQARRRGQDALLRIQGALVVARASGDTSAFRRTIRELPELLTA